MSEKYYVGDPTQVVLQTGRDISTATALQISARRPDGTEVTWTATALNTTDLQYDAAGARWDMPGVWRLQGLVTMPGRTQPYRTETVAVWVYASYA